MKLLALLSIVVVFELANGSRVTILDQNVESINSIVEQVCWYSSGTGKQISKIPTVAQIAEHLRSLPSDHKLTGCRKLYLDSIDKLSELVSTGNDNVCSSSKISAIEQFHRAYILKGSPYIKKAPQVLATFFIHYVYSVSQICANETAAFLYTLNSSPETNASKIDKVFGKLADKSGLSFSSILQYSDIFLLWTIVDMLALRNQDKMNKYLSEGEKRVVIAAKNPQAFFKMQEFCRNNAKPLYSYSLLTTIRLIDMGYYPLNSRTLELLNSKDKKQARRFYELTKVCESLLPVRVVEQSTKTDSETVLLSRQEVEDMGLVESKPEPKVDGWVCKRCSMEDVVILESVTTDEAIPIAKRIKSDINSRKSAVSKLLKIFVTNVKANFAYNMKRLFGEKTPDDIEIVDETPLDTYEVYEEDEIARSSVRSKRGLSAVLTTIATRIIQIILFVLYIIWGFVTMFVFFPMYIIYLFFSWFTGLESNAVEDFLLTGGNVFGDDRYEYYDKLNRERIRDEIN